MLDLECVHNSLTCITLMCTMFLSHQTSSVSQDVFAVRIFSLVPKPRIKGNKSRFLLFCAVLLELSFDVVILQTFRDAFQLTTVVQSVYLSYCSWNTTSLASVLRHQQGVQISASRAGCHLCFAPLCVNPGGYRGLARLRGGVGVCTYTSQLKCSFFIFYTSSSEFYPKYSKLEEKSHVTETLS